MFKTLIENRTTNKNKLSHEAYILLREMENRLENWSDIYNLE